MKKRILVLLLIVVLLFALSGMGFAYAEEGPAACPMPKCNGTMVPIKPPPDAVFQCNVCGYTV